MSQEETCTLITRWVAGLSVPVAMLARAFCRPHFYLPLNGLQRLAFTVWLYLDGTRTYRYWSILKRIEEPHIASKVLEEIFGTNDDVIAEVYSEMASRM